MPTIKVRNGDNALVDSADDDLAAVAWRLANGYARGAKGYMHRIIAARAYGPIPKGMEVDHINGLRLDNRRANLRLCTRRQNCWNSAARGGKSKFRGVHQHREKWRAQITITLGMYETEEQAATAYQKAAEYFRGEWAREQRIDCGLAGDPK